MFQEVCAGGLPLVVEGTWLSKKGLCHGFTTRRGGVSRGHLESLNVGVHRGDDIENVRENVRRAALAMGAEPENTVMSAQQHHDVVYQVTQKDAGKGVFRPTDITDADALMTNVAGIPLLTYSADCVLLLFFDPVRRAVAACHSGWRGTCQKIGAKTVLAMQKAYGTNPENVLCAVGPSIGPCHFETDGDVASAVAGAFKRAQYQNAVRPEGEKFFVNLWALCRFQLEDIGLLPENISVLGACTVCEKEKYFSHRGFSGKTGNLGGMIALSSNSEFIQERISQ